MERELRPIRTDAKSLRADLPTCAAFDPMCHKDPDDFAFIALHEVDCWSEDQDGHCNKAQAKACCKYIVRIAKATRDPRVLRYAREAMAMTGLRYELPEPMAVKEAIPDPVTRRATLKCLLVDMVSVPESDRRTRAVLVAERMPELRQYRERFGSEMVDEVLREIAGEAP